MNSNGLYCDFLIFIPSISLSVYLTTYLSLKFGFYRKIDEIRGNIRKYTASAWTREYKYFTSLLDNIDVKYIRVLVPKSPYEDRTLRVMQIIFVFLSLVAVITGIVMNRIDTLNEYVEYLLLALVVAYCIFLTALLIKTYYEYRFYQLLEELNKKYNQQK